MIAASQINPIHARHRGMPSTHQDLIKQSVVSLAQHRRIQHDRTRGKSRPATPEIAIGAQIGPAVHDLKKILRHRHATEEIPNDARMRQYGFGKFRFLPL
jgi:hypothetical protein